MRVRIQALQRGSSFARQFMAASFVILVCGMSGIGWWVGQQIEQGVVHRTAATTALYVDSFIAPYLQTLGHNKALTAADVSELRTLLHDTALGRQIVAFKVWGAGGEVLYSTQPTGTGAVFPVQGGLARAWQGIVTSRVSDLRDAENGSERSGAARLIETYSPVRLRGTNQVIAVAEFYQTVDDLQAEVGAAQWRSWLVVGTATLAMYLLLAVFVRRISGTLEQQQAAVREQVVQLTRLLAQNEALHARVRRAAARTTALNDRFLHRISAELHDGPAQDLALGLLRLDHVSAYWEAAPGAESNMDLDVVQDALRRALQEVRAICAGLAPPQLGHLTLAETVTAVVRAHERRTGTYVALHLRDLPAQVPPAIKITLYRLVQEGLNNAYRHGAGQDQQVSLVGAGDELHFEVTDSGPGFDSARALEGESHLGLVGMRERVESLGGRFVIESAPGQGARVQACLFLPGGLGQHER